MPDSNRREIRRDKGKGKGKGKKKSYTNGQVWGGRSYGELNTEQDGRTE